MKDLKEIPEDVSTELVKRFYRWAVDDALQEVEADFPYSSTCQSAASAFALWLFGGIRAVGKKRAVARACVNRFILRNPILKGNLTPDDSKIIEWRKEQYDSYKWTPDGSRLRTTKKSFHCGAKMSEIRNILKSAVVTVYERQLEWAEDRALIFTSVTNGWLVRAMISFDASGSIDCRHSIHAAEHIEIFAPTDPGRVSIGGAEWVCSSRERIEVAANALATYSRDYLNAMNRLLSDISNPLL